MHSTATERNDKHVKRSTGRTDGTNCRIACLFLLFSSWAPRLSCCYRPSPVISSSQCASPVSLFLSLIWQSNILVSGRLVEYRFLLLYVDFLFRQDDASGNNECCCCARQRCSITEPVRLHQETFAHVEQAKTRVTIVHLYSSFASHPHLRKVPHPLPVGRRETVSSAERVLRFPGPNVPAFLSFR